MSLKGKYPEQSGGSASQEEVAESDKWSSDYALLRARGMAKEIHTLCFRNSAFTSLLHSPVFVKWLRHHRLICRLGLDFFCLACHLAEFAARYWSTDTPQSDLDNRLKELWEVVKSKPQKQDWDLRQQDVGDLLTCLLDFLKAEQEELQIGDKKEKRLDNVFWSRIEFTRICLKCTTSYPGSEALSILYCLPPPSMDQTRSIEEGIAMYLDNLVILDVICKNCGIAICPLSRASITSAPEILIVQIRRFTATTDYGNSKFFTNIKFQEILDLTSHYNAPGRSAEERLQYRLVSIIEHSGWDLHEGHYITFAQDPRGQWVEINDEKVTDVDFKTVAHGNREYDKTPYVFVYSRMPSNPQLASTDSESESDSTTHETETDKTGDPNNTSAGDAEQGSIKAYEVDKSSPRPAHYPVNQRPLESSSASKTMKSRWEEKQRARIKVQIITDYMTLNGEFQGVVKGIAHKRHAPTEESEPPVSKVKKPRSRDGKVAEASSDVDKDTTGEPAA